MSGNHFESLWTVRDVAEFLAVAEKTVRRRVNEGAFPALKLGGSLRFRPEDIRHWVITEAAAAQDRREEEDAA